MKPITVLICSESHALVPRFNCEGEDAGMDICSAENKIIPVGQQATIRTGLKIAVINHGYAFSIPAIFVRGRSGLASKGIWAFHGTIDLGYRGEICIILRNFSDKPFEIRRGDRIAQLIFVAVDQPAINFSLYPSDWKNFEHLFPSKRDVRGFGSSGLGVNEREGIEFDGDGKNHD